MNEKSTDVVNDIETMGMSYNSVICSIGSTSWNKKTGVFSDSFHVTIDWNQAIIDYPGKFTQDQSTIDFWDNQSEIARLELKGVTPLKEALILYSDWWFNHSDDDTKVWGNGVEFDLTIMENAFNVCGVPVPWNFRNKEHMRTIVNIGKEYLGINPKDELPFDGEMHVSVDDACHEGKVIFTIQKALRYRMM